jgi:tetratricopeptide (TPR) repeat protein
VRPDVAAAHYGLARLLQHDGQTNRAKEEYELTLQLFPEFPRAHYGLGTLLEAAGDDTEARRHYETALHQHANYPAALHSLAMLLMRTGQVEASIEYFEQLRRLAPSFDTNANLAGAYARANRPTDALATAQVAINMGRARTALRSRAIGSVGEQLSPIRSRGAAAAKTPKRTWRAADSACHTQYPLATRATRRGLLPDDIG